jgi:hypothetical protein
VEQFGERPDEHSGNGLSVDARFLQRPRERDAQFSLHYGDAASHGWFNPNAMFSPTYDKRRHQGHGNNGVAFAGCRGLLEFEAGTGTPFDGMPASWEEEVADEE